MNDSIALGLTLRNGTPDLSDFANTVEEMMDLGLSHVEIPAYNYDLVLAGKLMEARVREVEAICRDRPFGFTVHGSHSIDFMGPAEWLPRYCDMTKAFIELCSRIGAPQLVIHSGVFNIGDDQDAIDRAAARQREYLSRLGDFAEGHNVVLCVENQFDFGPLAMTIAQLAEELRLVNKPSVRATFDFSHGLIHATQYGYDFLEQAKALSPYAEHLHLHDSFGLNNLPGYFASAEGNASGFGDIHLPLGWGSVPWAGIAEHCIFPRGLIAIHELNMRFWRDRHEAIAAARQFLSRIRFA